MWVVVGSVCGTVCITGEKVVSHCRNSYIALHIPRLHKYIASTEHIHHELITMMLIYNYINEEYVDK